MATTGGHRLRASLRKAKRGGHIDGVEVGYFPSGSYAGQGTPVSGIA